MEEGRGQGGEGTALEKLERINWRGGDRVGKDDRVSFHLFLFTTIIIPTKIASC